MKQHKNDFSGNEVAMVLLPNQLYHTHKAFHKNVPIILIEEFLFFTHYKFHQQKLVLHRASMKQWQAEKQAAGFTVNYVQAIDGPTHKIENWIKDAAKKGLKELHIVDPIDYWVTRHVNAACKESNVQLQVHDNPNFIHTAKEGIDFFKGKKHYHQTDFYIATRKIHNLLLEKDGKPLGGKWTFDAENREKFPKNEEVPILKWPKPNEFVEEAISYVSTNFKNHYGNAADFKYPTNRKEALVWLKQFLHERFEKFGVYEDAMVANESHLYHGVLTPMLNTGLLQPDEIIEAALDKASNDNIPLNSLEGFIRQITGWREFIRIVYEQVGREQRTKNYWGFTRKIPASFYTGETGIVPIDKVIKKLLDTAYNHHIERLMILGNFMVLCEFDPDEVYQWFMEMYIDSYDWVMVPNVYGMTQFADGGLMTTKPYISGSNYLMKMGDWSKGNWQVIWDGLFWRFMHVHRDFFLKNPRLGMLIKTFDKMSESKQQAHLKAANDFLASLDK